MCDEYGNYVGEGYSDDGTTLSMSHASTTIAGSKKNRKEIEDGKLLDPGYNKFYRTTTRIVDGVKTKNRVALELYSCSDTPGRMIRSAIGGAYHSNYRVGKVDEYIFFKVGMSTGECRNGNNTMYFDTPEQYEKIFNTTLSQDLKNNWYSRFNAERKYREKLAEVESFKTSVVVR